ncbi:hypothetical protein HJG60_011081 [Phyllostomus discolor]|uniref:Uncharacterized protein n=1 Tax=Phyllostomus discolor TaxID=89673 RepID=A0A834AHN5_9CHIR|nr:hypothetical protein HJG60_011081 [Phyllostomus discolor]
MMDQLEGRTPGQAPTQLPHAEILSWPLGESDGERGVKGAAGGNVWERVRRASTPVSSPFWPHPVLRWVSSAPGLEGWVMSVADGGVERGGGSVQASDGLAGPGRGRGPVGRGRVWEGCRGASETPPALTGPSGPSTTGRRPLWAPRPGLCCLGSSPSLCPPSPVGWGHRELPFRERKADARSKTHVFKE